MIFQFFPSLLLLVFTALQFGYIKLLCNVIRPSNLLVVRGPASTRRHIPKDCNLHKQRDEGKPPPPKCYTKFAHFLGGGWEHWTTVMHVVGTVGGKLGGGGAVR